MDEATFRCLLDAYDYGSFNGRSPADIYEDWEQGAAPPEVPLCSICRKEHHWCAMASFLYLALAVQEKIQQDVPCWKVSPGSPCRILQGTLEITLISNLPACPTLDA